MKKTAILVLVIGLFSCNQGNMKDLSSNSILNNYDSLEVLYYQSDTIIRRKDTLIIVNSRFDTTVMEIGIFTYLQFDYPLTTSKKLIYFTKSAIQFDKLGQKEKAIEFYKKTIDFYFKRRPEELEGFSCMNQYMQYEVNSAILCSYAYEKLEDKENAIKILQPYLANGEALTSKIHVRYIELCIDKFGMNKVKAELKNCVTTLSFKKQDSPVIEDWVVNVFGANIGVRHTFNKEQMSISQADSVIKEMDFYKLIRIKY